MSGTWRFRKPLSGLPGPGFTAPPWKGKLSAELIDLGDGVTGQQWCVNAHGVTVYACSDGRYRYYRDGQPAGEWPGMTAESATALQRYANGQR